MNRVIVWRAIAAVLAVALVAVAGSFIGFIAYGANSSGAVTSTIVETGSSLQAPLFGEWAPAYQGIHKDVLVAAASSDSGTGIKDAESGLAAIGAADLPAGDVKGIESIPVTVAGVAVIYNLSNASVNLSGPVLAGIYSGRITNWDDPAIRALNPHASLPSETITPVERSDSSGTTYQFTSYLQQQSDSGWPIPAKVQNWPVGTQEQGSNAMVSGCAKIQGCIAYVGVSYVGIAESQYHLHVAALADGAGKFLLPTGATLAAALAQFGPEYPAVTTLIGARNGYPITNYEYAVVKTGQSSGQAAAAIRSFLLWAVTDGSSGKFLSALNFQPLPANVLAASAKMISEIR